MEIHHFDDTDEKTQERLQILEDRVKRLEEVLRTLFSDLSRTADDFHGRGHDGWR